MITRRVILGLLFAFGAVGAGAAQDYPNRPVTWVVPAEPGGSADTGARLLAKRMSETLGQQIVIDNRAGAGGSIGVDYVRRAKPDGYTFGSGTNANLASNLYVNQSLSLNPMEDFEHIGTMWEGTFILAVGPGKPWKTVAELIAFAKQNPGRIKYGSAGVGTGTHMSGVLFEKATGDTLTHVPYKGSSMSVLDLMSGVIDAVFEVLPNIRPHIETGKVRPLAVFDRRRMKDLPDVQTMPELGQPDAVLTGWASLQAPKGTPQPIVDKLSQALSEALKAPEVVAYFEKSGLSIMDPFLKGATLKQFVASENVKWKDLHEFVQRAGAKPQ